MSDIVPPEKRSRMMAGIRSRDTRPEILIRKALHLSGFRYRLHDRKLPGTPDLVFPGPGAVLFVNGCFWHGHRCHLFKLPGTRTEFWSEKISKNRANDQKALNTLLNSGWRVGCIWECAVKGKTKLPLEEVVNLCGAWIRSSRSVFEITGA